ncbi:SH3 domain-containing protein [Pseudoroseomonas wenyumeiae]|uniref:SH3 domain-containing protein n=3 Tax=Teichococcus wenyumeiae TaxID=2478470 RepID=A0ABX9VM98_9PROT|nr:SH3 domain-containing protein [Pseudoroseomonas wenyumeiae]
MLKVTPALLLLALLGLPGCDDPPEAQQQAGSVQAATAEARRAAEEQVRARLRIVGDMSLRAIQVYPQQVPGSYAVCGQINPTGAANDPFIPWVATVALQDGKASRASLAIGLSNVEASRVYLEMVDRCFEGGGPRNGQMPAVSGLPPLPSDTALAQQREAAQAPPAPTAAPSQPAPGAAPAPVPAPAPAPQVTAASGGVTTTSAHPVNIRSSPAGGGAVVRVVPRASALRVFGEAPGGWLQVGEEQPFGWLHSSMLER